MLWTVEGALELNLLCLFYFDPSDICQHKPPLVPQIKAQSTAAYR